MATAALFLERFNDPAVTEKEVLTRLAWLRDVIGPRLERFLGYYRNPVTELAAALPCARDAEFTVRPFRHYQELGLPARITGFRRAADGGGSATGTIDTQRKEVVIENDIAWRVEAMVDFAAGQVPEVMSRAHDPELRARLDGLIATILAGGGGNGCGCTQLVQRLVQMGCISGSAWVQVRPSAALLSRLGQNGEATVEADHLLCLELLEARQVMRLGECIIILRDTTRMPGRGTARLLERVRSWFGKSAEEVPDAEQFSFDIIGPALWQRYEKGVLVEEGENRLGFVPMVRYENGHDPAAGSQVGPAGSGAVDVGMGDVESLIPMQDELNTRLSDRAFRVTMTSFRMYLGKGIEDFIKRPIGPGQMWGTDNPDATIESFGGDQGAPSEEAHINEVREALDKISGVSPVAAGLIRGKLGNLTSAVALRLTLIALLARTERKRAALTQVLREIVRHALCMLDLADVVKTDAADREIDVHWPTATPESEMDRIGQAQAKLALGVPRDLVLQEMGYRQIFQQEQRAAGETPGEEASETANAA